MYCVDMQISLNHRFDSCIYNHQYNNLYYTADIRVLHGHCATGTEARWYHGHAHGENIFFLQPPLNYLAAANYLYGGRHLIGRKIIKWRRSEKYIFTVAPTPTDFRVLHTVHRTKHCAICGPSKMHRMFQYQNT